MSSRSKGTLAEQKACAFLRARDFHIVEQNFYAKKLGEIDIIATKGNIYHFVEVKSAKDYQTAIDNMTSSKLSKLKRSIDYYVQTKNINSAFCMDVIIVTEQEIEWLENITI